MNARGKTEDRGSSGDDEGKATHDLNPYYHGRKAGVPAAFSLADDMRSVFSAGPTTSAAAKCSARVVSGFGLAPYVPLLKPVRSGIAKRRLLDETAVGSSAGLRGD